MGKDIYTVLVVHLVTYSKNGQGVGRIDLPVHHLIPYYPVISIGFRLGNKFQNYKFHRGRRGAY